MKKLPLKLEKRLQNRKYEDSFRELKSFPAGVDFFSNDYLGFAREETILDNASRILKEYGSWNGATGSRLLSGNHKLFGRLENQLASFHNAQAALLFNSGYDANVGFFSAVPQKNDLIFFDELAHASIRDGLKMSLARSYKFRHNDPDDLRRKLARFGKLTGESSLYIVTESVFSMDGDSPDLEALLDLADEFDANLIVDEAHATGVLGRNGEGLVQKLKIENRVFARIHTFGKAIGCHGAVILCRTDLKDYLVNFCRSLIYTTAMTPHTAASISAAYRHLEKDGKALDSLNDNIRHFRSQVYKNHLQELFIKSDTAIQACLIPGNTRVKLLASGLQKKGFIVKPILSPTVPAGKERLRFCLHTYNSFEEISQVLKVLGNFVANNK